MHCLGEWLLDIISELCVSWLNRWDEYVSPAIWTKRTLPDISLSSNMSLIKLPFGRKPCRSRDSFAPISDEAEIIGELNNFVGQHEQNMREVCLGLVTHESARSAARVSGNATISWPSAGVSITPGNLAAVRESESTIHRDGRRRKL